MSAHHLWLWNKIIPKVLHEPTREEEDATGEIQASDVIFNFGLAIEMLDSGELSI
jgi:hypothetical protein